MVEGASRLSSVLTPNPDKLEFHPTPVELWEALIDGARYSIPHTLIVQFDDDKVDQSSKLATILDESSSVKFARLRGMHLTPVSAQSASSSNDDWKKQLNSRADLALFKILSGRKEFTSQEEAIRDLRQTIARYISEIVTKD